MNPKLAVARALVGNTAVAVADTISQDPVGHSGHWHVSRSRNVESGFEGRGAYARQRSHGRGSHCETARSTR